MTQKQNNENKMMKRAGYASIGVAGFLILLKTGAFFLTQSVSILSGLFDSIQDFMTSCVNAFAIHQSIVPADLNHRFGHGKAQAIGGLIQAFIIAIGSGVLLIESGHRFFEPQSIQHVGIGVVVSLFSILMTIALVLFQSRVIRLTGSLSIKADKAHYAGDVLMNVGIIISMIISAVWQCGYIDAIFGVGVSGYLFFVVYQILRESFDMLMDSEMPADFRQKVIELARQCKEVQGIHDLKTRRSGSCVFVQFCMHLPDNITLKRAHGIMDQTEMAIRNHFSENVEVLIHAEPDGHRRFS